MEYSSEKYDFFHLTFVTYYQRVLMFTIKYLKNKELSENITQDTFITFWENIDKIDRNQPPYPYLFFVAKNKILNHLRKERIDIKYRDYLKWREIGISMRMIESSTMGQVKLEEVEKLIVKSMDKMSDKSKEAFILNRFKHYTFDEISELLGVSVKTVEYRMASALRIVTKFLKDYKD